MNKVLFALLASFQLHALQTPEALLAAMSLRQKIGQLFVVAAASNFDQPTEQLASSMIVSPYNMDPAYVQHLITNYGIGGVIFLYKSDPATQMVLMQKFQATAAVPLLICQDCEWGLAMRLDINPAKVVRYPRAMTLGAIQDLSIVYDVAYEIGKQCAAVGVHMNFAPVVDVNNNPANPVIHDRSFGDNPERVAQRATIFAQGLHNAGVLACAKHFPGHGDVAVDSHIDLPVVPHDRARLDAVELAPFKALIHGGIPAIMHAHLHAPALDASGTPSSLSHSVVRQLLQQELGFQGLSVTDALGMGAVLKHYAPGRIELAAFLAGNDILLCPVDVPQAMALIEAEIVTGCVSEQELDRRLLKILRAKYACFISTNKQDKPDEISAFLVRQEAYDIQERAYRAAITFVPQHKQVTFGPDTLQTSCIIQIGTLPDNVFATVCKKCIADAKQADTVIVAVGSMNKNSNDNFGIAQSTQALVTTLHAMGKTVVVVLFGTPYSIPLFPDADAIILAYEDAVPCQQAVGDVLRGELVPRGVLPVRI